jgi:hypothetical protein
MTPDSHFSSIPNDLHPDIVANVSLDFRKLLILEQPSANEPTIIALCV